MKMSSNFFIFSLMSLCLAPYTYAANKEFISSKVDKSKRLLGRSREDAVTATVEAIVEVSTAAGTNVISGANNATNAAGYIGPNSHSVTDAPYKITSCDQVLLIDGLQTITDFSDYCVKTPAFFTLNIYFANLFDSKDSAKLTKSISFDKLNFPKVFEGAKGCVQFQNSQNLKRFAVCGTEEQATQIIAAFQTFSNCRAGDNLKQSQPKKATDPANPQLNNQLVAAQVQQALQAAVGSVNPYYRDLRVPGQ